mmetsp:Transcript_7732/g.14043  ORF Transcript_7732/g.14043 Transcript_7732/m.14043 type:complete len:262 (+) Transcript_7732:497-1282(+)
MVARIAARLTTDTPFTTSRFNNGKQCATSVCDGMQCAQLSICSINTFCVRHARSMAHIVGTQYKITCPTVSAPPTSEITLIASANPSMSLICTSASGSLSNVMNAGINTDTALIPFRFDKISSTLENPDAHVASTKLSESLNRDDTQLKTSACTSSTSISRQIAGSPYAKFCRTRMSSQRDNAWSVPTSFLCTSAGAPEYSSNGPIETAYLSMRLIQFSASSINFKSLVTTLSANSASYSMTGTSNSLRMLFDPSSDSHDT